VVIPTPDLPATRFFQSSSTPSPRGVTHPMPVTTTRRLPGSIARLLSLELELELELELVSVLPFTRMKEEKENKRWLV